MARTPTTFDPFNAVAEPKRRQVLEVLGTQELSVNEIVKRLGWNQPMVSKHLGVLKEVGLVSERRVGRQRLYRVNAERLRPIYDWVAPFERYWSERYDRLDEVLEECINKGIYSATEFSDIVQYVKRQRQLNKDEGKQNQNIKLLPQVDKSAIYTKPHTRKLDDYLEVLEGVSK